MVVSSRGSLDTAYTSSVCGEDVHVGSGIQFPSLAGCNHLFGVHDPYEIHNTWLSSSSLGLSSSETTTLQTFRASSHVGPMTLRLSRG